MSGLTGVAKQTPKKPTKRPSLPKTAPGEAERARLEAAMALRDAKAAVSAIAEWLSSLDALELALGCGAIICFWVLCKTAPTTVWHITCGLVLMGMAAWTLVQAEFARQRIHKAGWYLSAASVFCLFLYWAFTVVFRAPVIKEGIGCGGVQFVHAPVHDEL